MVFNECKIQNIEVDWIGGYFDLDESIEFREEYTLELFEKEFSNYGEILLSWIILMN
jgi:hypothetical protein